MRDKARIQEEMCKQEAACRYNAKAGPRYFHEGDLIWCITSDARKNRLEENFAPS